MRFTPSAKDRLSILLMVLAAGCVDAIGFKSAEIFPANMTSNAVLIASALGGASPLPQVEDSAFVLVSFCMGSALAAFLMRLLKPSRLNGVALAIILAGFSLSACGVALLFRPDAWPFSLGHLLVMALAMGIQSTAALAMNIPGAGITTVITSTLTAAISKLVASFPLASSKGTKVKNDEATSALFPLSVFGCYLTGAFLGVFHLGISTAAVILLAGMLLAGVGITTGALLKEAVPLKL